MGAFVTAIGFVVGFILLLPLLVGGIFVIVVVANRADPDLSGRRPAVVYSFATAFFTLFIALFSSAAVIAALSGLIHHHGARHPGSGLVGNGGFPPLNSPVVRGMSLHPVGDAAARDAVLATIITLIAVAFYWLHVSAAARLSNGAPLGDPIARVRSSYVSAVSFVCVFVAILAAVIFLYDIFRLIAPGTFSPGAHGDHLVALHSMLPALYLLLASVVLLLMHLRHAPAPLRPGFASRLPYGPLGRPSDVEPPSAVGPVGTDPDTDVIEGQR